MATGVRISLGKDDAAAVRKALINTGLIEYHADSEEYVGKNADGEALATLYNKLVPNG